MSRQLDLQIYLALNGYPLKEIPEERYEDYMSEPHYSTDPEAMLGIDREMRNRGYSLDIHYRPKIEKWWAVYIDNRTREGVAVFADTEPLARALAAYRALAGDEWDDGGDS